MNSITPEEIKILNRLLAIVFQEPTPSQEDVSEAKSLVDKMPNSNTAVKYLQHIETRYAISNAG